MTTCSDSQHLVTADMTRFSSFVNNKLSADAASTYNASRQDRWSLLTRIYDSPRRMVERAGPAETFLIPGALLLILLIAWRTKNPVLETRFRVEKRKDTAIHRLASSLQYLPLLVCCKFMSFE